MKRAAALPAVLAASVALVACGGSGSTDTSAGGAGATATTAGGSTAGASTVQLTANADNQLAYDQKTLTAKAGSVTIDFDNPAAIQHNVAVSDSSGKVLGTSDLIAQGKTTLVLADLKPGSYTFYCTVPGHREAGMQGTLAVN
ncbi:MAG: plastocyanin/azurin family copper-binding protein [Solirubrobacterales bacterium]